jgi:hypothetical protein
MNIIRKLLTSRSSPYWFIAFFLVMSLVQAFLTQLTSDEGYYWYLSTHLDWGYYDHPPFLPFLIHLGRSIFAGELGVRFMGILLMCLGFFCLVRLVDDKKPPAPYLYLILLSVPLLNYITVVVFPDTPLVAVSVFYLYFYKRFLERDDWVSAALMGAVLSLMLYAKYHGILVPAFVIASNPALLRSRKFYLSLCVAALLYAPHLYWQYTHDFISFKYHLVGRSMNFQIPYLTEFIGVQPLVLCPALIFVPFVYKVRDRFERALQFIVVGTLGFFLLAELKGYVHFHWTSITLFPLIILGYRYYQTHSRKLLYILAVPALLLIVFLRTYLAFPILPVNTFNGIDYFHNRQAWADDIKAVAGTNPVLFESQLREAPLYSFYSGMQGVALYPEQNKKSQYEVWNAEDQLQGKDVVIVRRGPAKTTVTLVTGMGKTVYYYPAAPLTSYENIKIVLREMSRDPAQRALRLRLEIVNHRDRPLTFEKSRFGMSPMVFCGEHDKAGKKIGNYTLAALSPENPAAPRSSLAIEAAIPLDSLKPAARFVAFGIDDGVLEASENSIRYPVAPQK